MDEIDFSIEMIILERAVPRPSSCLVSGFSKHFGDLFLPQLIKSVKILKPKYLEANNTLSG